MIRVQAEHGVEVGREVLHDGAARRVSHCVSTSHVRGTLAYDSGRLAASCCAPDMVRDAELDGLLLVIEPVTCLHRRCVPGEGGSPSVVVW